MSENPKNNWTKVGKSMKWSGILLILFVLTFSTMVIFVMFYNGEPPDWGSALTTVFFLLLACTIIASILTGLWVFMRWCGARRFLFGCACLFTLVALFYAEEDWRGKYDWDSYQSVWMAKGEKFDLNDFLPPPVPDEQNFAMSPVCVASLIHNLGEQRAQTWYGDRVQSDDVAKFLPLVPCNSSAVSGTNLPSTWSPPATPNLPVFWPTGGVVDLKPWQDYYRNLEESKPAVQIAITPQPQSPAADVLLALSKYDPVIERLRQDSQLPDSRFPVQYNIANPFDILLPHLAAVKGYSTVLELRALAELQNHQSNQAFNDIVLMLRLMDSVHTEPFIITHLVRMAIMQMALQAIYEGLANHQWSDAQLAGMDSELAGIDYLADFQLTIRSDRAANTKMIAWLEKNRSHFTDVMDLLRSVDNSVTVTESAERLAAFETYVMPKGWFYQVDILMSEADQSWLAVSVDHPQRSISPSRVVQTSNTVETLVVKARPLALSLPGQLLAQDFMGGYAKRAAYNQASADLARVAIALERYRLAHGAFPDSLDALSPQFMPQVPHDIINGNPLHYRRTSDGQFVLYCVGWNETDDGGVAVLKNGESGGIDMSQGDWVWQYPEK